MFGFGKAYDDTPADNTNNEMSDGKAYGDSFATKSSTNTFQTAERNNTFATTKTNTSTNTNKAYDTRNNRSTNRSNSSTYSSRVNRTDRSSMRDAGQAPVRRTSMQASQRRHIRHTRDAYSSRNDVINGFGTSVTNNSSNSRRDYSGMTQEQMVARGNELKKDTNASLDRALATAYKTEEIASDTMETLHYQGKQLENIDQMLHETNENLDQTEHTLKGMKSIFGAFSNWFKKAPKYNKYANNNNGSNNDGNNGNNRNNSSRAQTTARIMKIQSDSVSATNREAQAQIQETAEDREQNAKLDQLLCSVKTMGVMADTINNELASQSQTIDSIDRKMDIVDEKMKNQTLTMRKIG